MLAVAVLLLALDTAAWLFACKRLDDAARDAVGPAEAAGWVVRAGAANWAGWPAAAEVRFATVTVSGSQSVFPPGLAWSAEHVRLRVAVMHPTILAVIPEGGQTIAAEGVPAVPFRTARSVAAVDLTGRDPARLQIAWLEAALPGGALRIGGTDLQFPRDGLVADLTDIAVSAGGRPLAPAIGRFRLQARTTRPFPVAATPADSARAWRAVGGSIVVGEAALDWGPLAATGRASIGLDKTLQPGADGAVEATGLPEFLDMMAGAGALPRSAAVAAKAVLALLSTPGAGGPVSLPLACHDGVLSLAGFPLLRLPPLAWE